MKLISFVTPLYNTPLAYLEELKSDMLEIHENVEWILVNDSPDNIILKEYIGQLLNRYDFIRYYENKENLGIYKSYLNGFTKSEGIYCAILDHDDRIKISKYEIAELNQLEYDIIYTNEYKIEENQKQFDYFYKPELDFLSIIFYFYTHHITYLRTNIVKKSLSRINFDQDKYSSIFDLCWVYEYLKEFKLNDIKIKKIDEFSYAWRVHEHSTARSISQKPIAYVERVKKVDEFFRYYGENPLVYINEQVPYSVICKFNSADTLFNLHELLSEKIQLEKWLIDNNIELINLDSIINIKFLKILYLFPLHYLLSNFYYDVFIPLNANQSYKKNIIIEVPYYVTLDRSLVMKEEKGILIKNTKHQNKNKINYLIIETNLLQYN